MNSFMYRLNEASIYLSSLPINHHKNALWDVLHDASWHQTLDWVLWIEDNKPLIEKIIQYEWITQFPKELEREIHKSFKEIVNRRK